ncbi:DUF3307 domain-containing protein [Vibrio alginolyticus]|uniref:DUF3307 domain-containing protein n=1 Tax=Vibrio alginolyticus TaxID=663 RepID=UPI003BA2A40D
MVSDAANVLFLSLFLGHIVGDFFLQPDRWVKDKVDNKIKSKYLVIHALLHGLVSGLIFSVFLWNGSSSLIIDVLFVFGYVSLSHWCIDVMKTYMSRSYIWFLVDQILHVWILAILTYGMVYHRELDNLLERAKSIDLSVVLPILIVYLLMLKPTAVLVGEVLNKWTQQVNGRANKGLEDAGKYIGYIERVLILTFVLTSQYAAIGFVLAAKSIFRMGDLRDEHDRQFTEYVMVGTLFSVSVSLFSGLFIVHVLGLQ